MNRYLRLQNSSPDRRRHFDAGESTESSDILLVIHSATRDTLTPRIDIALWKIQRMYVTSFAVLARRRPSVTGAISSTTVKYLWLSTRGADGTARTNERRRAASSSTRSIEVYLITLFFRYKFHHRIRQQVVRPMVRPPHYGACKCAIMWRTCRPAGLSVPKIISWPKISHIIADFRSRRWCGMSPLARTTCLPILVFLSLFFVEL